MNWQNIAKAIALECRPHDWLVPLSYKQETPQWQIIKLMSWKRGILWTYTITNERISIFG